MEKKPDFLEVLNFISIVLYFILVFIGIVHMFINFFEGFVITLLSLIASKQNIDSK